MHKQPKNWSGVQYPLKAHHLHIMDYDDSVTNLVHEMLSTEDRSGDIIEEALTYREKRGKRKWRIKGGKL